MCISVELHFNPLCVCVCVQWSPQHQGLSCQQFRRWQQQNQPDQNSSTLLRYNSIGNSNWAQVLLRTETGCKVAVFVLSVDEWVCGCCLTVCVSVSPQSVHSVSVCSVCLKEAVFTSPAVSVSISSVEAAARPSAPDLWVYIFCVFYFVPLCSTVFPTVCPTMCCVFYCSSTVCSTVCSPVFYCVFYCVKVIPFSYIESLNLKY